MVSLPARNKNRSFSVFDLNCRRLPVWKLSLPARGLYPDIRLQISVCICIRQYVGKTYTLKNGETRRIQYGDIVILFRTLQKKALAIYNDLISANIPVVAGFNVDGYATKEIKDLINLLRVLDNPYNDVYLVGVCLSCLGGLLGSPCTYS